MSVKRFGLALASISTILVTLAGTAVAQCRGDFNGDGYDDLAIGVPGKTVTGHAQAGVVNLLYGGPSYLSPGGSSSILHQDLTGVVDQAEVFDSFGAALAAGDFDGDGYDDLAVGAPGEMEVGGSTVGEGAVHVFYGSAAGLGATGNELWHQGALGFDGDNFDQFGAALAAGDYDGNGYDDLMVGVPGRDTNAGGSAGVVYYLRGGAGGLGAFPSGAGAGGEAAGDAFGRSLATGDFDGDGYDDLAVGAPNANVGSISDAGVVRVFYGTGAFTVDWFSGQTWHQDVAGVQGGAEASDRLGHSLAASDFDGDGFDDLAIGVPSEDYGAGSNAGVVHVLYGLATGLSASGDQLLTQGADAESENSDQFGASLAAGDTNGDGRAELIVGVPGEDSGRGALHAFRGTSSGLTPFRILSAIVSGGAHDGDGFASALTLGDFNGNGRCDLAVGVPLDDVFVGRDSMTDAGSVTVLATGFVQFFTQSTAGVAGTPAPFDRFGASLSRGPR